MQYEKKAYTTLTIAVLVLSMFTALSPTLLVQASTGHPKLGGVDDPDTPTTITIANYNVSIKAGSNEASKIDGGVAVTDKYFAIIFYINDSLVTFSGGQFDLYISKDGYSQISTDDKCYATGFYVSDLDSSPLKKVTKTNTLLKGGKADFYIGKFNDGTTDYKVLIGPIPFDITADYKFIKIFDGSVTSVAVSSQIVEILPSIELSPTSGPGGRSVTLTGVALSPGKLLNLTYGSANASDSVFGQATTGDDGKFTYTWNIKDLKKDWTGTGTIPSDTVNVYVWYNATATLVDSVTYTEYARAFIQLKSVKYGQTAYMSPDPRTIGAGNNTLELNVYVFDTIVVAGVWWNPTGDVAFRVGDTSLGSVTPNATGYFNTTLTVPELPMGTHVVKVTNAGVTYIFSIIVHPTLILEPEEGPVDTTVTCTVYGFPANRKIGIYWYEKSYYDDKWYNFVNGTTGSDGKFNVTVTFKVPHAYGGDHDVVGDDSWPFDGAEIAGAVFTVTPTLYVEPSTIKNDGSEVTAVGTGFDPEEYYVVNIDNTQLGANVIYAWSGCVYPDGYGDLNITFIAAGFRPGLHVVSLYVSSESPYKPVAYALFTVSMEGDLFGDLLTSMNATIVNINGTVATIDTNLGTLMANLTELDAKIVDISEDVVTIETNVGTIMADVSEIKPVVTSINNGVATIQTTLGTLTGTVTSIQGTVATINTNVGTIMADVSSLKTNLSGVPSGVASTTTLLYGTIVLALIAALASIVAVITLMRKVA